VSVKYDEERGLTLDEFCRKAKELGETFSHEVSKTLFTDIEAVVKAAGNEILFRAGDLTAEDFFRLVEKVEVDFDEYGRPLSGFCFGPELAAEVAKKQPEWDKDERVRARGEELMRQKREDFREREARRRLVD
jgi:hypothetical protein